MSEDFYICKGKTKHCDSNCRRGYPHKKCHNCEILLLCRFGSGTFHCKLFVEEEITMPEYICQGADNCSGHCIHKTVHKRSGGCGKPCNGEICVEVVPAEEEKFGEVPMFEPPCYRVLTAKSTSKETRQYMRNK